YNSIVIRPSERSSNSSANFSAAWFQIWSGGAICPSLNSYVSPSPASSEFVVSPESVDPSASALLSSLFPPPQATSNKLPNNIKTNKKFLVNFILSPP